jgi:hypothetical protein
VRDAAVRRELLAGIDPAQRRVMTESLERLLAAIEAST